MRPDVPVLVAVTAVTIILLAAALYLGEMSMVNWSPAVIMTIAAVLRLLFLFRSPELSDDIYRYLWDGLQTLSGNNPYAVAPLENSQGDATLRSLINHSELVTIYPPAAQLIFAIGAGLDAGVLGIKLLLTAMDLFTCVLILKLLSSLQMPSWRAVLYAWHPLPVLEISASGHIDAAALMFLFSSLILLLVQSGKYLSTLKGSFFIAAAIAFFAGILFACAGLVKLLPFIFLPGCLLLARKGSRSYFLSGVIISVAGLSIPYMPDLQNVLSTLRTYIHHWEFASFSFRNLRYVMGSGEVARLLLAGFFSVTSLVLYIKPWLRLRTGPPDIVVVLKTCYYIAILFLFLTPTLHPWYALYLACLLPFAAGSTGMILSWSVFLSYSVLIIYSINGVWVEDDLIAAIIFLAPVSGFFLSKIIIYAQNRFIHRGAAEDSK